MVLTPHIRAGQWDNSLGYLRPRFEAFQRLVASKAIDVKLYLGSEVSLQPESLKLLSEGQIPFVGGWDGMKVMLLDFPDARIHLRRLIETRRDLRPLRAADVMRPGPRHIAASALVAEAAQAMEQHRISVLLVLDEQGALQGILGSHDLMRAKVI